MSPSQNFEIHSRHLADPNLPIESRYTMAQNIRDSLEVTQTTEYFNFLKCYTRAFSVILYQTTSRQFTDNPENKLRNVVLDIISRLPLNEVVRPFVQDLFRVAMHVLATDNEHNGALSVQIFFDLARSFKQELEKEVQPFIDFVCKIYKDLPLIITHFFESGAISPPPAVSVSGYSSSAYNSSSMEDLSPIEMELPGGAGQLLNPSTMSFKVMKECPLVVMFIFQTYNKLVLKTLPYLLPSMIEAISIQDPEKVPTHLKAYFNELKDVQVKTVSFLSYLLKAGFLNYIRPHEESIYKGMVGVLLTCSDSVDMRREVLLSMRQMLGKDTSRRGLLPLIDTLLDERALLGTGRACFDALRPLACNLQAEIVNHVRRELSLSQFLPIISLFSSKIHDSSLLLTTQTICACLMLNLVEPIFEKAVDQSSAEKSRVLLGRIFEAFVGKLGRFRRTVLQAALNLQVTTENSTQVGDSKHLIKTLFMGMKTIIWSITNAHFPRSQVASSTRGMSPQMHPPQSLLTQSLKGMREDEVRKTSRVLKSGMYCIALFKEKQEEREMVNLLSRILAIMEPRDIMDMLSLCMPELFESMISNHNLVHIFTNLPQDPKVFRPFSEVVINFLVSSKLDILKHPDSPAAKLVLRLFQFLFGGIRKAPSDCEGIFLPHVPIIMETCMRNITEVESPLGYLQLLHTMFQALAGGKFELLLRDLIPMLHPCLNMLLNMLEGPTGEYIQDLLLELCLTLPARLSSLLPYLSRLMKPLVMCLKGSDHLVSLGLKKLNFWIDSLNPDFLELCMGNVISEVILELWSHLRPAPYLWGRRCLKILGKLGGRNRRFLKAPLALEYKENPEYGFQVVLTFEPSTHFSMCLDRCINLAVAAVKHKNSGVDVFYRKKALKFLQVCLSSQLNLPGKITDESLICGHLSNILIPSVGSFPRRSKTPDIKADSGVKTKTRLMAESSVLKILLMTIVAASAEPDLQDPEDDYVVNVYRHFAIVFHIENSSNNTSNSSSNSTSSNLNELDPLIFFDALLDVLADENRVHAKAALRALNTFAETLLFLACSKQNDIMLMSRGSSFCSAPPSVRVPIFEKLLPRLLHCCYGSTWQAQIGGVMGLGALVGMVTVETLCTFQLRIIRGLVNVLKRLPVLARKEEEETSQVLMQVLRVLNNVEEAKTEACRRSFQGVVEYLTSELFNTNTSFDVRKIVQSSLALLARRTGKVVSELLEPFYQPLLKPLLMHRLQLKTIDQQVGTVTALNFCLTLRPPLLKPTQELVNILLEAVQIAEADETVWVVKVMDPKAITSLKKLQTRCIELSSSAMAWEDLKTPNFSHVHEKIFSMFLKSLTSRTPEVVPVAKEGLRKVILQQRISKGLLQKSLRPVLGGLKYTKSLSLPLLQGLAHLLELLSHFFNDGLGQTLLDNLKNWLEPEKLVPYQESWKAGEETKIAAAIIEAFHLLPSTSGKFLVELVTLTIDLEAALPPGKFYSEINSPYRLPLTKFLNRYPTAAVDYFLDRLCQIKYSQRFMYIIGSDAGQPLREELAKSPEKILASAFPEFFQGSFAPPDSSNPSVSHTGATSDAYFQGLGLIKILVKLLPGWLPSNRVVFDLLVLLWNSNARTTRLRNEQELNKVQAKESKWLIKCFLNYYRHNKTEFSVLFEILSIFLFRTRIDFTFLKEFCIIEVAEGYQPSMKNALLSHFLDLFTSKQLGQDHLVVIMQMLILPMLSHAFQNGQTSEVVDANIIIKVAHDLLDPPKEVSPDYDEPLRIELLQLSTLFVRYLPTEVFQYRKKFAKICWDDLRREDCASKQWAFINICHFMKSYHMSDKSINQVLVQLFKRCQTENKKMVNQALDALMPALPRIFKIGASMPDWIRHTRSILVEEGHSVANMIHIFQLIVRHSDLFYNYRTQYIPQMVNFLSRLGFTYIASSDNRRLAIQLAGLVVCWERKRQKEKNDDIYGFCHSSGGLDPEHLVDEYAFQSVSGMSPGGSSTILNIETRPSAGQLDEEFKLNTSMEEMVINFLIKVTCVIEPNNKEGILLYKQALEFLSEALEAWPSANVNISYLENLLNNNQQNQSKDPAAALVQGLDVMNKVVEKQPHLFVQNNCNLISQILDPCFKYITLDVGKSLCSLLKMILLAFPPEASSTPQDVKTVYDKVNVLIQKHLTIVAAPQTEGEDTSFSQMLSFVLYVMENLVDVQDNLRDSYKLVHVLHRLARDMGSATGPYVRQDQTKDPDCAIISSRQGANVGVAIANLKSILKLIGARVLLVPECKQSVTESLNSLLSVKGTDSAILICLLDAIKGWIEKDSDNILVPEEVLYFLQKLSQVDKETFPPSSLEEWDNKYLQLLYGLCADPNKFPMSLCQEVFQRIEKQYLLGLRAKDPRMRMKFFSLYHESLGKTLFTRLQYIIQVQDWEALSDVFWLKNGLDLLLTILVQDSPIILAPNSAKLPPLVSGSLLDRPVTLTMVTDVTEGSNECPLTLDILVQKHGHFMSKMSRLQVADLVVPLRDLAHKDADVAYCLWVSVFPIVWASLQKEEHLALANPMIALLSKDYHKNQRGSRPNVVQALLEGLRVSQPQPHLPSELIKYIGKTYNAWHIALDMLESRVMVLTNDSVALDSLAELYQVLNEEDLRCGLWKKRSIAAETQAGLALVQQGYWQQARSLFYQAMSKATQGIYNSTIPKTEMLLWEEQWLYCSSQLGEWDVLVDFGKLAENHGVLLDSVWKQRDWTYLKNHVIPRARVEETPKLGIIQAYLFLRENNAGGGVGDAASIAEKGVDLALNQWWQKPEMSTDSRMTLLQQFQQLVEIQESRKVKLDILAKVSKPPKSSTTGKHGSLVAELKDIFAKWRQRTPNVWDNMSVWYDVLTWRNEIFGAVIDAFKDFDTAKPELDHIGSRDMAWTVNKLAHISRKQGLHDVCVSILDKIYQHSNMEVEEAFVKIREKLKAFLETKGELINGLNLINSTNLDFFHVKQKAELFRLKGDYFLKLNDSEGANMAYSNAISLFKNLSKGWISWGNYCEMAYKESPDDIWLEFAVSCFLQGIKFGSPNSRSYLAHVLYLLNFDTPNEPVGRAFDKYLDQIPLWVWLSWIPQLLLSLQRPEAPHCKIVLLKIAAVYPQALYYWLRTYWFEWKSIVDKPEFRQMEIAQERAVSQGGDSLVSGNQVGQGSQSNRQNALGRNGPLSFLASAVSAANDIMEALKSKHANLVDELEILLTEIGSKFVILLEERLLAVISAMLHRCYTNPSPTRAEVPQFVKNELSGICRACFSVDAFNKNVEFVKKYKQEIERDLDPQSTATFPASLSELTERLKHWENVLQRNVEDRFPAVLKLEEESRVLHDFHVADVEVPGQYFTHQEVAPDHTIKIDRIGADIPTVRRHGSSYRRLTLVGSDGSQCHFIVQSFLTANAKSDERILQLFRAMNQMLNKHKESRRRHMCSHTPIIIPVWSQVRLVEDDLAYSSFLEVYESYCARNGIEADFPITYFKEQLNQTIPGQISPDDMVDLRLQAYNDITDKFVIDRIFSQYMYKILPNESHLYAFKKQFATQLALSCFVSFILQIGGRSPNKTLFAKNTGKIFQTDFHPAYDANGMIEFNEPIPFRLTRNLQSFFSQFGVEGLIVSAIYSAAQAMVSPTQIQHLWHHLAMFFRDELLTWSWRRTLAMSRAPVIGGGNLNPTDLRQKISTNVERVIDRLNSIAPHISEEVYAMDQPQSVYKGVTELVEAAMSPRNLCMMSPTWHPWF